MTSIIRDNHKIDVVIVATKRANTLILDRVSGKNIFDLNYRVAEASTVPGEKTSLLATEIYQVLDTSDIPGGYINILTAKENELNSTLSKHENIDGIWYFGNSAISKTEIIKNSTSNLKRYWCPNETYIDWTNNSKSFLDEFLYNSTQVKNIWIPYGE